MDADARGRTHILKRLSSLVLHMKAPVCEMKFSSIGCNNLCSVENGSFKIANNSSSDAVKSGGTHDRPAGSRMRGGV